MRGEDHTNQLVEHVSVCLIIEVHPLHRSIELKRDLNRSKFFVYPLDSEVIQRNQADLEVIGTPKNFEVCPSKTDAPGN